MRTRTDAWVCVLVNEKRAADVEKVESHAIDYHRKQEEPDTVAGIADSEETEAQHPAKQGNEHNFLNAESRKEEGNKQDTERLAHLRE